jgi:hypothetical protein
MKKMATKLLPGVLFFLRGSIASLPEVEQTLPKHRGDAMGPEYLWWKIEDDELSIHGYWPTWDDFYGDAVVALVKALAKTGVEGTAGVWHDGTRDTDNYHVEYRLRGGAFKVKVHDPQGGEGAREADEAEVARRDRSPHERNGEWRPYIDAFRTAVIEYHDAA